MQVDTHFESGYVVWHNVVGRWPVCQQHNLCPGSCKPQPRPFVCRCTAMSQSGCTMFFRKRRWAVARLIHSKNVPCNCHIPLFNIQTGKQTFEALHDAKTARDHVYDIRKVSLVLIPAKFSSTWLVWPQAQVHHCQHVHMHQPLLECHFRHVN